MSSSTLAQVGAKARGHFGLEVHCDANLVKRP